MVFLLFLLRYNFIIEDTLILGNYVGWFSNAEPTLPSRDKPHVVTLREDRCMIYSLATSFSSPFVQPAWFGGNASPSCFFLQALATCYPCSVKALMYLRAISLTLLPCLYPSTSICPWGRLCPAWKISLISLTCLQHPTICTWWGSCGNTVAGGYS